VVRLSWNQGLFEGLQDKNKATYDKWQTTYAAWAAVNPDFSKHLTNAVEDNVPTAEELCAVIPGTRSSFKDEVEIFKCLPGRMLLPPEAGPAPAAGRRSLQRPQVITRAQAVCAAARVQIKQPLRRGAVGTLDARRGASGTSLPHTF